MKRGVMLAMALAALAAVGAENPEKEFREAVKAGQALTAERAFKQLVESKPAVAAADYLAGAETARENRQETLRKDRLAQFLRTEKGWNADVEAAAWELCRQGGDSAAYLRLADHVDASRTLFACGRRLQDKFLESTRPAELLKVTEKMLAKFTDKKDRDSIIAPVYALCSRDLGGFPRMDVARFIIDHPVVEYVNPYSGNWTYTSSSFANDKSVPAETVLDYMLATKCAVPWHPGFWKVVSAMQDAKNPPSKAFVGKFLKLEPIIYSDRHKEFDYEILRQWFAVRANPDLQKLFPEFSDPLKNSAKIADVFRKVCKCLPPGRSQMTVREMAGWLNRGNAKLSVEDQKKLAAEFPRGFERESVYDRDVTGESKRLSELWKTFGKLKRNGKDCPAEAHGLFRQAAAAYPWQYPDDAAHPRETRQFGDFMNRYFDLCHQKPESSLEYLRALWEKLGPTASEWGWVHHCVNQARPWESDRALYERLVVRMSQVVPQHEIVSSYAPAKGAAKVFPDGFAVKNLKPGQVVRICSGVLYAGREADYSADLRAAAFAEMLKNASAADMGRDGQGRFADAMFQYASNGVFKAQFPYDKVAGELLDNLRPDHNAVAASRFIANAGLTDPARRDRYLQRYLAALDRLPAEDRVGPLAAVLSQTSPSIVSYPTDAGAGQGAKDTFLPVFRDRYLAALKAVPRARAPLADLRDGVFGRAADYQRQAANAANAALVTNDLAAAYLRLVDAGVRRSDNPDVYRDLDWWVFRKACPGDRVSMAKVAAELGAAYHHGWLGFDAFRGALETLKEKGEWEILYLVVRNLRSDAGIFDKSMVACFSQLAAEAATKLPGIYPVSEKDPAYPLYVAADEYNRRNTERAWDLLRKNLPAFERTALKLPPDFTGWAVEQLRLQRGKKDELLVKARNLATQLLADEAKLSPALAARLLLTRAECYRDQQNFEAAKLEYQTIRNSAVYHGTPAGKQAMFRAVDLLIDLGNASQAEQTIEYWLSQPEPDIQAQAHYFLARIAYERQDYDETIKQLREVFAIDFTHTEARFLQGKWKLATGSEVDDTEVMIGSLTDRTTIRPGQPLTITVQDRNLSVAGGGASIPVLVKTEPGGDLEYVQLYPSVRDPNLFKGVLDIQLGRANPSNMVLEVTGRDKASYVIDPSFLRTRGLPQNAPKVLAVVDDARLAIGAGAPRTDEAKSKKELAKKLDEGAGGPAAGDAASALAAKLRPGNPLYIVVSDRDRSTGEAGCEIPVTVTTTSGDILSNLRLKELKPFSGIFRGEVQTALPPPRAFASDSAVGFNPCDTINSGKGGHWKSLADGQPGKWIEVDTMASHAVKEARIAIPAPEEVRAIRLVGRLATETMELGSLPVGKPEDKAGLRVQRQHFGHGGTTPKKTADGVRAWFQAPRAPKAEVLQKFVYEPMPHWDRNQKSLNQFAYLSGVFAQPGDRDYLRFRFAPTERSRDAFRSLWVVVAIDGEKVFEGQGPRLADEVVTCEATAGAHRIELFVQCSRKEDGFELQYEPFGEDPVAMPMDWFDMARHDPIRKFLSDKAVITRTKEGFTAAFEKPVRMRSLRWEFTNIAGQSVDVEKLFVTDKDGRTVIPVATDFTDAQQNDTLEVAPGDRIAVSYGDERTSSGETRVLEKTIDSSFNDADVHFLFEVSEPVTDSTGATSYRQNVYDAYRFQPGDTIVVAVRDPDCDLSPEADKVTAWVRTSDGERREMELVEVKHLADNFGYQSYDIDGTHSGTFAGLLRTCRKADAGKDPKALPVKDDDVLTLSYEDRENTNPGIPFVRTAKVQSILPKEPRLTLFHTRKTQEVDRSVKAQRRLEAIRRRPGNEQVTNLCRDVLWAVPMARQLCDSTNAVPVNVATPVPIRVSDPSLARHKGSRLYVEAVAGSELKRHEEEGGELASVEVPLVVGGPFEGFRLKKGAESQGEARAAGSFNGVVMLCLGAAELASHDEELAMRKDPPPVLGVNGSDTIRLRIYEKQKDGVTPKPAILERTLKLVSNGSLKLMDSTWSAERTAAHAGEKFFVAVDDADRDLTDDPDRVTVDVRTASGSVSNRIELAETMPHSGVFQGALPLADGYKYGDRIVFSYRDDVTLPGTAARTLCATGTIHRGADGSVRLFSKRFRDRDSAVLVQFRLAECLFEQAKEFRTLKQKEKSSEAIAKGKAILEEALRNYPDSSHVAQGEYLLANLYQELATEEKDAGNKEEAQRLYQEALGRFTSILAVWPEGEYGAKAQFHKAFCLEMLGDFRLAGEEYVKMTYLYPESELVGDATIRLATYYFKTEKRYGIAGKIYDNFQRRFPTHEKAARSAFMAGSCYVKEGERLQKEWEDTGRRSGSPEARKMFQLAVRTFIAMTEKFPSAPPVLKAQSLYWAGDTSIKAGDDKGSYFYLKRTILEYPETEWARRARGLLLQESERFKKME